MIDAERWVLCEAWLASGLRIRWAHSFETPPKELFGDNGDFWYAGSGEWVMVLRTTGYQRFGQVTAPSMATDDMRHEMAHWLTADEDQRRRMNFGTPSTSADDIEERAASAERVLSAVVAAAARIVDMAISPRDKR